MLGRIFRFIGLALLALVALAGLVLFSAPSYFRAQLTRLATQNGPTAYLIYAVDADRLRQAQLERVADQMGSALRRASIRYAGRGVVGDAARVRLVDPRQLAQARIALNTIASAAGGAPDTLAFVEHEDGLIEARLPLAAARDTTRRAVAQSIEVIKRRVNPTGVLPITVTAQGEDRILIEARGETESDRLRALIGATGMLTFHMVRDVDPAALTAGPLPAGTMLAQPYRGSDASAEIVEQRPRLTGEHIAQVSPATDTQTGDFVLHFSLDREGTRLFCHITTDNVGARFAVLIDGRVVTAPRINEPICGGTGQISGGFTARSASDVAAMLSAGATPTQLVLVEQGLRAPPQRAR
jgi:protein-export membrane protein SecD